MHLAHHWTRGMRGICLRDETIKNDSNMECTCLTLGMEIGRGILQKRGVLVPEHATFKYDNTAREGKNQIVAKYGTAASTTQTDHAP